MPIVIEEASKFAIHALKGDVKLHNAALNRTGPLICTVVHLRGDFCQLL